MDWDIESLRSRVPALASACSALEEARGVGPVFSATQAATSAQALAMADVASNGADEAALARLATARGGLQEARERALERLLGGPLPIASDAASRWALDQADRHPRPAYAVDLEAEVELFQRWQQLAAVAEEGMAAAPPPTSMEARAVRARQDADSWAPHLDRAAALAHEVTELRAHHDDALGVSRLERAALASRASLDTVQAVLHVARRARPILHRYLRARARCLGVGEAPLAPGVRHHPLPRGRGGRPWTVLEAREQLRVAFAPVPRLAAFLERAMDQGWVHTPASSPFPGTCMTFPDLREVRLHVPFDGSRDGVITLAHEVGHGFHAQVLFDQGPTALDLPTSLAESASLVAEGLARAMLAHDDLGVLDAHLAGATKWLLDAGQTLELELMLEDLLDEGPWTASTLLQCNRHSVEAWFGPLEQPWSHSWASQWMLYLPGRAALPLPYLLAYVFASLLGAPREASWVALLQATEDHSMDQLARDHLGVDLADPETYDPLLVRLTSDVERFERLVAAR